MDKALSQAIGKAARAARSSLQLTQEDAAERIGVSVEFYSRIERGTALPSLTTFVRMAVVLNVSTDAMIGLGVDSGGERALSTDLLPREQEERPEIRRILRRLRKASTATLRIVTILLKEMDRAVSDKEDEDGE